MNFYAISGLINAVASSALGLFVYLKNIKNSINKKYSLFCLSVTIWSYCYFFWQISDNNQTALFWCRALMAGAIFIPVCFFDFTVTWLNICRENKKLILFGYILCFIFLALDFTPLFVKGVAPKLNFKYWPEPGITYPFFLLMFFGYAVYSLYLMFKAYKNSTGNRRNQIKYVLIGMIIGYFGGSTNYPLWYDINIPPIGNIFGAVYVVMATYAIARHRLMDINIVITKGMVYTFLLLIFGSCYLGLMLIINKIFFQIINYQIIIAYFILFLFMMGWLIFLLPRLKIKTEKIIERALFKENYKYRQIIREFNKNLTFIPKEKDMLNQTINHLSNVMGVPRVCILLMDEMSGDYIVKMHSNLSQNELKLYNIPMDSELVKWLIENKKAFLKTDIGISSQSQEFERINKILEKLKISLCIPLIIENKLIGILLLGDKKSGDMFSDVDIELLESLGNQLSLAISYKKIMRRIIQADKLIALGTLAAGLAHEMRNPLSSIQTFFQLFPIKYKDKEFREKFSKIASRDVDRINRIIEGMLAFAAPKPPQFFPLNLNEVVDETLVLLDTKIKRNNIKIVKNYDNLPITLGDKEQLKQVFLNLFINAIQSMSDSNEKILNIVTTKEVEIITPLHSGMKKEYIKVEIADNGCGIDKKFLNKIFDPFFTTKSNGTGLGLSIVERIIQEHNGFIEVNSQVGEGTVFYVYLPVRNVIEDSQKE